MKREQAMLAGKKDSVLVRALRPAVLVALLGAGALAGGCVNTEAELQSPQATVAPYEAKRGEVLWAVAPLRNESGTLAADTLVLSDRLVAAVEEVRGVRCVPLNRTMEAIVALKLQGGLRTPAEARMLAQAMGVDGVVVGTLTAWDPYTPQIGLSLALFARDGDGNERTGLNPRELSTSTRGTTTAAERFTERPSSTVSENLDAKNHQVLSDVRRYAEGRVDKDSALGWKRYISSMDLYQEFAAHYAVEKLIQAEWSRTAGSGVRSSQTANAGNGKAGGRPPARTIERWAGENPGGSAPER